MEHLSGIDVNIRNDLRPGDLGRVIAQQGEVYAAEYGFDHTFEAYVAETLGEFGQSFNPERNGLWQAELDGRLVGVVGIIGRDKGAAQLRWFLVHPEARRRGVGSRLVRTCLDFCRSADYRSVFLWTVDPLVDAARIYQRFGFRKTHDEPRKPLWGTELLEQRYELTL